MKCMGRDSGKDRFPVILHTGFNPRRRAFETNRAFIKKLVCAGYIVIILEPRGIGASMGYHDGFWSRRDAKDVAYIIDLIGVSDWCDGNVGMFGGSNCGMTQLLAAAEKPVHLKAIIPNDNNPDFYYQNFPNGASALPYLPDVHRDSATDIAPVDSDPAPDFPLAAEAAEAHTKNKLFLSQYEQNMFQDTFNQSLGYSPNMDVPAWESAEKIKFSSTKIYANASWYDSSCTGAILGYKDYGGKLLIGPWSYCEMYAGESEFENGIHDWIEDHLRFFDCNLKSIDNSIEEEPPIRYYRCNFDIGKEWQWAEDFPLDNQESKDYYFSGESLSGIKNGNLVSNVPKKQTFKYQVETGIEFFSIGGKLNRKINNASV